MKNINVIEYFVPIPTYEGYFEVSNLGGVKTLSRMVFVVEGRSKRTNTRLLSQHISAQGYYTVSLSKDGVRNIVPVHQLVAMAFLGYERNGKTDIVVDHKDLDKLNNNLDNLRIVTNRENCNMKHIQSSSSYTGVGWHKQSGKWRSYIRINNKQVHLGQYDNELDASKAYQNKLKEITL